METAANKQIMTLKKNLQVSKGYYARALMSTV